MPGRVIDKPIPDHAYEHEAAQPDRICLTQPIAPSCRRTADLFVAGPSIWMAGGSTVAIHPTGPAETVRYVLEHSGAGLLFAGKRDHGASQAGLARATGQGLPPAAQLQVTVMSTTRAARKLPMPFRTLQNWPMGCVSTRTL